MNRIDLEIARDALNVALNRDEIPREDFARCFFLSITALNLTDTQVAIMFQLSRPTVSRWTKGESCVHPIGRPPILKHLLKLVEKELSNEA